MVSVRISVLLLQLLLVARRAHSAQDFCVSKNNVFTVKVDLFAGELGYYLFEECGDQVAPTIGLEIGETYTFNQADVSNYFHPLGFSYMPSGDHYGNDDLRPEGSLTEGNPCVENMTCPASMYFLNDEYLGTYSNIPEVAPVTVGLNDTGVARYESMFFHPLVEWHLYGNFTVQLRFTDANYNQDIFYFCHIHQFMSGRIKLLKDGVPVNEADTPAFDYQYDHQGEFDKICGTFGLENYTLPRTFCPSTFVCGMENASESVKKFAECINAMNCLMFADMTTNMAAGSAPALFLHEMIPHHQNAVNMAKALIHSGAIPCADVTSTSENCTLFVMMRSIITGQNYQIQVMDELLTGYPDWKGEDDCELSLSKGVRTAALPPNQRRRKEQQRQEQDAQICTSKNNVFTVSVNYFVSRLGYYQFEECGDQVNPTIGIEVGETYTFIQSDITNYYHPIGFACQPDQSMWLDPAVTMTKGNPCPKNLTCPAPMYFMAGDYLGNYSNIPDIIPATTGEGDIGLNQYMPKFFYPLTEWLGYGNFSVKLRYTDAGYKEDLFYFCHIHQMMTGRIKLLQNGVAVNSADTPALPFEYDTVGQFDETCGSFDLDRFELPQEFCPQHFICDTENLREESIRIASCFDAMNCAMLNGMTTGIVAESEKALFMRQMIPHHENAVNMAKTVLFTGALVCDDLTNQDDPLCILKRLMYEIISEQNYQIQIMKRLLENYGNYTEADDCNVTLLDTHGNTTTNQKTTSGGTQMWSSMISYLFPCVSMIIAIYFW